MPLCVNLLPVGIVWGNQAGKCFPVVGKFGRGVSDVGGLISFNTG